LNTFLPYEDFATSAKVLDRQRLGKQRVEVLQLLRGQWLNHPASRMWRGFEFQLAEYGIAVCREWVARGYKDSCLDKIRLEAARFKETARPDWVGDPAFHLAHQSNLVRKLPEHYRQFFPDVSVDIPYIWPR